MNESFIHYETHNSQQNVEKSILLVEIKSEKNYIMLMKSIQDQKSSIDQSLDVISMNTKKYSDDTLKECKKEITGLQNKMQKVGDSIEKRLKRIEKINSVPQLDTRFSTE